MSRRETAEGSRGAGSSLKIPRFICSLGSCAVCPWALTCDCVPYKGTLTLWTIALCCDSAARASSWSEEKVLPAFVTCLERRLLEGQSRRRTVAQGHAHCVLAGPLRGKRKFGQTSLRGRMPPPSVGLADNAWALPACGPLHAAGSVHFQGRLVQEDPDAFGALDDCARVRLDRNYHDGVANTS